MILSRHLKKSTGEKVNFQLGPRRSGDVPAIYADHALITARMGWKPEHDIEYIMRTAWAWEKVRRQESAI